MCPNSMFHCILLASIVVIPVLGETEWVDPVDMNDNTTPDPTESEACKHCIATSTTNLSFLYYKRIIRQLVEATVLHESVLQESEYKGQVKIRIPIDTYGILKDFMGKKLEDARTLRTIDKILSEVVTKNDDEKYAEAVLAWIGRLDFAVYTRHAGVIAGCLVCAFVAYKLLQAKVAGEYITMYMLFLAWIVDFAFTWINLIQVGVHAPKNSVVRRLQLYRNSAL